MEVIAKVGEQKPFIITAVQLLMRERFEGEANGTFGSKLEEAIGKSGFPDKQITGELVLALVEEVLTDARHLRRDLHMAEAELAYLDLPSRPVDEREMMGAATATAVQNAERIWSMRISEDPAGFKLIDEFIRSPGGLWWSWMEEYGKDTNFSWGGAFVAFCWAFAGLSSIIRRDVMASTYRLFRWARENDRFVRPPAEARPGDIIVVGNGYKPYGNQMGICIDNWLDEDGSVIIETIEGNAQGRGPNKEKQEGVVRVSRRFDTSRKQYHVQYVVRFEPEDLEVI